MAAPTQQIIVMACDMPFLTAPFLVHLAARGAGVDAAIPRDDRGWHPLSASWARSAAPQLRARIDAGALRIVDASAELDVREIGPAELAPFDPDGRLLVNINTPDDYTRALEAAEPPPRIV